MLNQAKKIYGQNLIKIYGPYIRKDNRKHIILRFNDSSTKTISYPKFLIEIKKGRRFLSDITIHHDNENVQDDSDKNLKPIIRKEHCKHHAIKQTPRWFICAYCKEWFKLEGKKLSELKANRKRNGRENMSGPYCSRSCAGHAGK